MADDPDAVLADVGRALAREVTAAVPAWVERSVTAVLDAWEAAGGTVPGPGGRADVLVAAGAAGARAAAEVGEALAQLAETDVDAQLTTPLEVVRRAVPAATAVLAAAGIPGVARDGFATARFPDDEYGLTPASLGVLGPGLGELGLAWGAAKAAAHRRRHRGSSRPPRRAGPRP